MLRQPFVHERIVGGQQLHHAAILAQLTADESPGFLLHRVAQVLIELRIHVHVGHDTGQLAQRQPLSGEIVHQRLRARIGQHATNLFGKDSRLAELSADRDVQQLVVWDAAPQEK